MAETEETQKTEEPKKASKLPLILGLVIALAGGGGSFFAIYSGMLFGGDQAAEDHAEMPEKTEEQPKVSYVEIEPMTISLGRAVENRHLRFRASLEVPAGQTAAVESIQPRVMDVLNSYLRAVEVADLEDPSALVRLRSQMLRRVQVVAGPDKVNDLLVMEFVLN